MESTRCLICDGAATTPVIETPAHMSPPSAETFHFVRCDACGLVFLNPRVPADELGAYYPDSYLPYRGPDAWGRYADLAAMGQRITDRRRARLVRRALSRQAREASRHDGRVATADDAHHILDVGCGQPTFLEALRASDGELRLTGIDFSASGWADDPDRWYGMRLIEGEPAAALPTVDGPADVITMWHYLEHDYAPRETLARLRAHAHDRTRLMIEVPDFGSLARRIYGAQWEGFHAPRHTAIYTRATLTRLLAEAGWEVERYTTNGTLDIYALWWMSSMERRGIDWSASMERRFPGFMVGRILTAPVRLLAGVVPLGVQLVTARRRSG